MLHGVGSSGLSIDFLSWVQHLQPSVYLTLLVSWWKVSFQGAMEPSPLTLEPFNLLNSKHLEMCNSSRVSLSSLVPLAQF